MDSECFEPLLRLLKGLTCVLIITWPLAVWKIIDLILWLM